MLFCCMTMKMPDRTRETKYRSTSWIDPRIRIRRSPIAGMGLFLKESAQEGEPLMICGGTLLTIQDIQTERAREQSVLQIGEDLYLGNLSVEPVTADEFLNHSCDPNTAYEGLDGRAPPHRGRRRAYARLRADDERAE